MAQGDRPGRHSRHPSRILTRNGSRTSDDTQTSQRLDKPKDDETIKFIKQILCSQPIDGTKSDKREDSAQKPLEELLPPLTSSNDVDVQLCAIIAVILSQFVQSWYGRITPDGDFVSEIVQIIAHCTRGLEERLRHVNLLEILLDEVPRVLDNHLNVVTIARNTLQTSQRAEKESTLRTIYHTLRPHHALTPPPVDDATRLAQHENEGDWCQLLVNDILPLLLPPEDLSNPCLDVLVSEIFSEMIMHNAILGKTSEPWLLWEGITKSIYVVRPELRPPPEPAASSPINRLEQFGLLSSQDAKSRDQNADELGFMGTVIGVFWSLIQFAILAWSLISAFVTAFMGASALPQRPPRVISDPDKTAKLDPAAERPASRPTTPATTEALPIVGMRAWSCMEHLTSLGSRMPWLIGCLSLLQWLALYGPGRICHTNSSLDRLMCAQVHDQLLNPALLPTVLRAIRTAVFPDNAMAPARVPPTSEETLQIKRECARVIVEAVPDAVRTRYFATKDKETMRRDVEDRLDLFADPYVNKHLLVAALDLIVVRLFPELADPSYAA
ncbi:hypothetical protein KC315_g202 [Hortaea werneckii]|uniref:PXA domain-containing protein n=1 Tax=Hortaea werneckii TaxID=91943 RepID=A0A3M6ZBX2_HORWE|nr:hypothetical protein KC315_g202 [Hortaea werneckii]RMY12551.1 hypothetical protein D0868_02509 [Hortaea werneckii]RMY35633.1 hypothetical protein D0866_04471 [Hortaea werneckii]